MKAKVLMLNGTSMAAIQALTVIDAERYEIHLCDPDPKCWGRFHDNCARFFACPHFGSDPRAFFQFVLERLRADRYDVILPVHEEGLLLAKYRDVFREYTGLLISDAVTFNTIMNKKSCLELARSLGIPIPDMKIVHSIAEIEQSLGEPSYLKLPYGTSSSGVRRISPGQEIVLPRSFADSQEFILQKEVDGDLCVIQSVFKDGSLVGSHEYQALGKGYGGGASRRVSIDRDDLRDYAMRFGGNLNWSGPLMLDFIIESQTDSPFLIEGNPRIGETYNATIAGLNICDLILELSLGKKPPSALKSRPGVKSHQMFTEVMAAVKNGKTLRDRWQVALSSLTSSGKYRSSTDEIIHPGEDPVSLLAAAAMVVGMPLITNSMAARLDNAATRSMAATPDTVRLILESDWTRG